MCTLFTLAGYRSGSEIELRIDPNWQPKPDVIASIAPIGLPYPIEPVDIVAEVLTPDDSMVNVYEKCRQYQRIGIRQILVLDPESRVAWGWSLRTENLERICLVELANGHAISAAQVWARLDQTLA